MSFDIDISITGDTIIASAVDRMVSSADSIQRSAVEPFGKRVRQDFIDATPHGHGDATGRTRLYENYVVDEQYSTDSAAYHITNTTPYLQWVLNGRKAVVAKPGKMLRFTIDGRVFFRKRVGPAKANPFDKAVIDKANGDAGQLANDLAAAFVRTFGGA